MLTPITFVKRVTWSLVELTKAVENHIFDDRGHVKKLLGYNRKLD